MKRYILSLLAITVVALAAWSDDPKSSYDDLKNLKKFYHNLEGYGRLGYSIGGTAPMGMPAEIRKLNKFILQPNVSFGVDGIKPVGKGWGILVGIHFENKAMHIDATVKNYHMEITKDGQSLEGVFTGRNDSRAVQWTFTVPVQAVYKINDKWKLKFGPYFSYLTSCNFDGFAYDGHLRVDDPTGPKILLGTTEDDRGNYDFKNEIRKCQWGLGVGVDYFYTPLWHLCRPQLGLERFLQKLVQDPRPDALSHLRDHRYCLQD